MEVLTALLTTDSSTRLLSESSFSSSEISWKKVTPYSTQILSTTRTNIMSLFLMTLTPRGANVHLTHSVQENTKFVNNNNNKTNKFLSFHRNRPRLLEWAQTCKIKPKSPSCRVWIVLWPMMKPQPVFLHYNEQSPVFFRQLHSITGATHLELSQLKQWRLEATVSKPHM